jgi:tRNA dimethylallyltransferase
MEKEIRSFIGKAKRPLVVIAGPTASGKTKLAVKLCKEFDGEVVSADSRQIYDEMEIGNERTKPEEMEGIPHHLLAIVKPDEIVTVADFKNIAEEKIDDILKRNKIPFLVGGTGLYIEAITKNFDIPKGDPDFNLRKRLESKNIEELLKELEKIDPDEYEKQKVQKNKRYIIRAIEIFHLTGKPKSEVAKKSKPKYDVYKIGIEWPREILYERINERTVYQVEHGMTEEVKHLIEKYDPNLPAMTSIGCKEVIPYLENKITKQEMIETLQQHNRNYAKRQITWLKRDPDIYWVKGEEMLN